MHSYRLFCLCSFVSIAVRGLSSQDTQLLLFISAPDDKPMGSMDEKNCMWMMQESDLGFDLIADQ